MEKVVDYDDIVEGKDFFRADYGLWSGEWVVTAQTKDGEIMAMQHKEYPVIGLQFHPESIYTEHGKRMVENFINGIN